MKPEAVTSIRRPRKATPAERSSYAAALPRKVYPLYGFVTVGGQKCAVEDLRGYAAEGDPTYEIMAPVGHHFADEGTHSLLARSLVEVSDLAASERLVPCTARCG